MLVQGWRPETIDGIYRKHILRAAATKFFGGHSKYQWTLRSNLRLRYGSARAFLLQC
jgi:hypothetical protein